MATTFKDLEKLTKNFGMGIAIRYLKGEYLIAAFFLATDTYIEVTGKDIESAFEALKVKLADTAKHIESAFEALKVNLADTAKL